MHYDKTIAFKNAPMFCRNVETEEAFKNKCETRSVFDWVLVECSEKNE
jgi:hypothetical protein